MNTSRVNDARSCLYWGKVMHRRIRPTHHRFSYRVFWGLFNLDELADLDRDVRGFSYNPVSYTHLTLPTIYSV